MWRERRRRGFAPREPAGSVEDTTTQAFPAPPPVGRWARDVLGEGFEARTLPLDDDEEGEVVATIVRHTRTSKRPVSHAVLYLHGWSDYFFQSELAEYWTERGAAFYALDLRKYGRSLRVHQTAGFVESLSEYDDDIEAALEVIASEEGADTAVVVMGHSTGGLVAVLWADRHPGRLHALVLNAPWLELQGSAVARTLSQPVIEGLARFQPKAVLPLNDLGFYDRTLHAAHGGEWTWEPLWRPSPSFPVRAGWLSAVLNGHAQVAKGLTVDAPILMLASDRTVISPRWSEDMRSADIVLDVELLARRAILLGPTVTIARIAGAVHDVILSPPAIRAGAYAQIDRWARAYIDRE